MEEKQLDKYFLFRNSVNLSRRGAEAHYHSYYEVYCLTDGEGSCFVDNKLYELQHGDVIIIPPGTIHGTHYSTEKHSRILLNFSVDYLPSSLLNIITKEAYLYRCEETHDTIQKILDDIEKEYTHQDDFSEESIKALLAQLVILAIRHVLEADDVPPTDDFIKTVINYVKNNYKGSLSLEDIAKECGVSKVHLSRKFKKKMEVGLSEYISIYRMKKAKELLLFQEKMSICDIAYECGFNDSNYFSWLFKKTYGVTPSEYRKNKWR